MDAAQAACTIARVTAAVLDTLLEGFGGGATTSRMRWEAWEKRHGLALRGSGSRFTVHHKGSYIGSVDKVTGGTFKGHARKSFRPSTGHATPHAAAIAVAERHGLKPPRRGLRG
jgi:hypothetical protein